MCGGEARALPNPAFRNVFTGTWAARAFQEGQPTLLSPEPARQAQPGRGGTVSSPWPRRLVAGSQVRSLRPALCSSTATGVRPEGKVMPHAEVGSSLPGQPKTAGCTKTRPQPPGEGDSTLEHLYPHDIIPGRETEIPLLSSHHLRLCPGWAGHREGKSLSMDGFRAKCAVLKNFPRGKPKTEDQVMFYLISASCGV